jgi:alkylation response protein AidB-like acyl-CoA dehydrogenase
MRLGPGKYLKGKTLLGGVIKPEEFDHFHEVSRPFPTFILLRHCGLMVVQLIIHKEPARCGTRGYMDGLVAGGVIGLPPVLNFGSPELQAKVVPDVLTGKKFICLAISEAFAGSDVGGMQTHAHKDGNEWVISGTKKYACLSGIGVVCLLADCVCE